MRLLTLLFFLSPLMTWAIDVRTNIMEVSHEGCCEQIGSFSLVIKENDLPFASFENPIYIRFRIIHAHGWSNTLVDSRPNASPATSSPIDLAIRSEDGSVIYPDLPKNAIQLVRLIEGEKEGWIRINYSGPFLVEDTNDSSTRSVSVSLGISGSSSVHTDSSTPSNGNEFHSTGTLASTILCANYTNTPDFNVGDLDSLDFISFDSQTRGVEDGDHVSTGANTGLSFSNDTDVARGSQYIACFDMTSDPYSSNPTPYEITFSKLSSIGLWYGCEPVPSIFLKQCGDFEWHPGSQLLFCFAPYQIDPTTLECSLRDSTVQMYLADRPLEIKPFETDTWQVEPLYAGEFLAGFSLTLTSGVFPPGGILQLDNIWVCLDSDYPDTTLMSKAFAKITNPIATDGDLFQFGVQTSTLAHMKYDDIELYHQIIPYTGYDQPDWEFYLQAINLSDQPSRITSYLRDRHGLLWRVEGDTHVQAHETHYLSIKKVFGEDADRVLAWVDLYSDQPFEATGSFLDEKRNAFELIESRDTSYTSLFGPHITTAGEWSTTAYILASGEGSPLFYFNPPGQAGQAISAIRFPGATAVYNDSDFITDNQKMPWFQIQAESSSANGQIFYFWSQNGGQIASLPLGQQPTRVWEFDHLGKPERGWWNGTVINNPNSTSTLCNLSLQNEIGEVLLSEQLEIEPESRKSFLLDDIFPSMQDPAISRLTITSDEKIISFLLMGMSTKDQLTDVPGNVPSGDHLLLPFFRDDDTHWTGLVICNTTDQVGNFTLEAFTDNGTKTVSDEETIPPAGKIAFLPSDRMSELQDAKYMIIKSTCPIRGFALIGNKEQSELASIILKPIQ